MNELNAIKSRTGSLEGATSMTTAAEIPNYSRLNKNNFLESAIYNPANYAYNTNYRREFEHKRKSEGLKLINELKHPGRYMTITGEDPNHTSPQNSD